MSGSTAHLTSWYESTKGETPLPLTGPSLTISPLPLPSPPTIFLFGGKHVHSRRLTNDIWAMDLTTKVWEKLDAGEGPCPRYFHSMDTWEGKLVCFGGMSESDPLCVHDDVWFFDCRTRKWLPQPAIPSTLGGTSNQLTQDPSLVPLPRYAHLSAVSRGQLVISGGQHSDNSWIYEINVYDLKHRIWISKTLQPELNGLHSKGAYRSVATSSKQRVIFPKTGASSYAIEEEGEGGDIWCFSNYDFAKVRREIEVIAPSDSSSPPSNSRNFRSPPDFTVRDETDRMHGSSQPPGLRFPTGGIVGNHFILCGLYLASSSAAFSIWALDLTTLAWKHLEPSVLSTGSWNRAVIWPERAKLVIFGNNQSDLASDYGRRAVNLEHVAIVNLETYGIYRPPRLEVPAKIQEIGLSILDEKLSSDFDVVCEDGRRIKCSKRILSERWPWFAEQERLLEAKVTGAFREAPALDINDTLLGSFTPAQLTPSHLNIPEAFPVCVALVQYFYTLSLSTPLQNRAPVLSALLFLSKQYKIDRLRDLVVHALHCRLGPTIAAGVYEIATLSGEQELQVRALNMLHSSRGSSSSRTQQSRPSGSGSNTDGSSSSMPTPAPGSGGPSVGGYDVGMPGRNGSHDYGQHRQNHESVMLPSDDNERGHDHIKDLLAALSELSREIEEPKRPDVARPDSPLDPELLDISPYPRETAHAPPNDANSARPSYIDFSRAPSSPTLSIVSSIPQTPIGSVRDIGIVSHTPTFLDTRSSSSHSYFHRELETLTEAETVDPKSVTKLFTSRQATIGAADVAHRQGYTRLEPLNRKESMASMATMTSDSGSTCVTLVPGTPVPSFDNPSALWLKSVETPSLSSGSTTDLGHGANLKILMKVENKKDRTGALKSAEIKPPKNPKGSRKARLGKFGAKLGENIFFTAGDNYMLA